MSSGVYFLLRLESKVANATLFPHPVLPKRMPCARLVWLILTSIVFPSLSVPIGAVKVCMCHPILRVETFILARTGSVVYVTCDYFYVVERILFPCILGSTTRSIRKRSYHG